MAQDAVDYIKSLWNKITNSKENKKAAEEGLRALEDFIAAQQSGLPDKPKLPDAPVYERLEYDAPSDEQIRQNAEQTLADYKNSGVAAIDGETEALRKKYEADKQTADRLLKQKTEALTSAYETAKKNTDDDLLRRGIARSSIAANTAAAIESDRAKAVGAASAAHSDEIARLTSEIDGLAAKREKALGDFNIAYAAKLTESINDLTAERNKQAAEALKYNNSLTEKEHTAAVDKTMKESDLYGEALDQKKKENELSGGKNGDAAMRTVYNKMAETLRGMNAFDAREALTKNGIFRANLNDYYYYLLYNEFGR